MIILLTIAEFFCGSLMFSYWLGLTIKKDIRTIGDGNPGAFNLWHAAGFKLGILGIFLDFLKGYLPLVVFIESGYIKGFEIIPVATAPILGHIFSPFLKFKGGKSIAVTFGVWSAVTRFEVSIIFAVILAIFSILSKAYKKKNSMSAEIDAFAVVLGMVIIFIYLLIRNFPNYIISLWFLNFILLSYRNKEKMYTLFKLRFGKS